ncbi:MAG: hypothetical protein KC496_12265 [Anaerolineae bacterium]|nr:hypothetical protein [Anaerolineae bacterium]
MEQWEYLTLILKAQANTKETRQFIKDAFDKKPKQYSPEAMIPELNRLGEVGWELVHMEPVPRVGGKEDIQFDRFSWSNNYFCVFKRRKNGAVPVRVAQPPQNTPPTT